MTKAIIDFSGCTGPDLYPTAQGIYAKMLKAAATFTTPPVPMSDLKASLFTFDQTLSAKASKATADTIAFNIARNELENQLTDLGNYVNIVAKGDAAIVDSSGFPSYETTRTADTAPPPAPGNVILRQGDLSGSLVARYKPDRQRSMNEVQINTGDPNTAASWTHGGMFSGGKAIISGLTPGTTVWVRVRTAGLKGVMGAWSDPAKIMVV